MSKIISNNSRIDTLLTTRSSLTHPVISFDHSDILGRGVEITYNFPVSGTQNVAVAGFQALSAAQSAAVRDALDMISSYVDVTFREVSAGTKAEIEFAVGDLPIYVQGQASSLFYFLGGYQYGHIEDVTITFDTDLADTTDLAKGSRFYFVAIHEIGHALGLDHPFEGITESGVNEDTSSTVMAYSNGFSRTSLEPSTLMKNDFLTLQYLYGENTSTFAGNTVHRLGDDDFRGDGRIKLLWDAGGTDTLDLSAITNPSSTTSGGDRYYTISLTEGDRLLREPSSSSPYDNVFIADGAAFENVVGTNFDDRITGTDVANTLEGGNGSDTLSGGSGNDTLFGNSFVETVEIVDPDSLVDVDGWLFKFSDTSGNLWGDALVQTGQAVNTYLGIEDPYTAIGMMADDNSDDELFGGAGNDILSGGGGADYIEGGAGDDTLTGGASADEFVFYAADGHDVITDFDAAEDRLLVDDSNWSGNLSATQVVNAHGSDMSETFVLDFGGTQIEMLGNFTSAEIAASLEIF